MRISKMLCVNIVGGMQECDSVMMLRDMITAS